MITNNIQINEEIGTILFGKIGSQAQINISQQQQQSPQVLPNNRYTLQIQDLARIYFSNQKNLRP